MLHRNICIVVLLSFTLILTGADGDKENQEKEEYLKAIKHITTFRLFQETFPSSRARHRVINKEKYEEYISLLEKEYREVFSLNEIKMVADFYSSSAGKKWLDFKSDNIDRFYAKTTKEIKNKAKWVCVMHPKVSADKKGSCPVCGMDLVNEINVPIEN